jgi:hypothetical protein
MSECAAELAELMSAFSATLERFNARRSGQRLGANELEALVDDIIMKVPFCCNDAARNGRFGNVALEANNIPKECFCQDCLDYIKIL